MFKDGESENMSSRPSIDTKQKTRQLIEKVLSVGSFSKAIEEINIAPMNSELGLGEKKDSLVVRRKFNVNDVVFFEEHSAINKAVITAFGKHGVTARDKFKQPVRLYYSQIIRVQKRPKR